LVESLKKSPEDAWPPLPFYAGVAIERKDTETPPTHPLSFTLIQKKKRALPPASKKENQFFNFQFF
jgi:hypothetical protein